ncbi:cation/H(+) antiporter 15-like isoform X2 [Primulina huaijiensis]|uniref:cation/H(+) antiporter 15-like isoform X2 n=1 Tax=Primulina huaijiensis TaxID=1492673 RepID=UPI003CC737D1
MVTGRKTRSRASSPASPPTKITSRRSHGETALAVKSSKNTKKSLRKANSTKSKKRAAKFEAMKPKKPPTAFFYFLEDFRKEYQEQNPDIKSMRDIGKACGQKWKTMTYEEKVHYYDVATKKRAEFDGAMESGMFEEDDNDSEDSEFDGWNCVSRGGILLGPSAFGRIDTLKHLVFPYYSLKVLEPMAHLSVMYYAFLVGLKMDVRAILRIGPKAMKIAVSGTLIPYFLGCGLFFCTNYNAQEGKGCLFWGAALSVTGFSVLAKILDQQHILHTEIGKIAISSALINDLCSWGFLALAFIVTSSSSGIHYSLICTSAFILLCVYYVRPALRWIIRKMPEGQGYSEFYICSILTGVALCGVITDACGTHPMIGAFTFGIVIPNEVLEAALVDKLEDFVLGILMPVFYLVCGIRTNIDIISLGTQWYSVGLVFLFACCLKIFSSVFVSLLCEFPLHEAVGIGILTNTKSMMAMIILEAGQIQSFLSNEAYSLMVIVVLVMTMAVTPMASLFRPTKNVTPYRRRTIQKAKSDEELRILTCIHNTRNVPSVIHFLRTSNPTKTSPISVSALQLVELVGRASAMLLVHNSRKAGPRNPSHIEAQADHIISAFDNFELRSEGVTTQVLTARCAYATMDEDICNIAKDRRAAFVVIPFHKQQTMDGEMEDINPSIRAVNEGVLDNAPCSVGILIERGVSESRDHARNIAVLYFGGPDDREALAYSWRMVEGSDARMTVMRFIPSADAEKLEPVEPANDGHVTLHIDIEREKLLDEDYLGKFKTATMNNNSISYCELVLNDEEETIKAIKSMDEHKHDLYMVGRGRGMASPLTAGLTDWCDCPELGPIGDLLVTSEFESTFSVLVVQQYIKPNKTREGSMRSTSSINYRDEMAMRPSMADSEGFEAFTTFTRDHDE